MNPPSPPDDVTASNADAASMLEYMQGANLLAAGRANLVSVGAVRQAFGRRWDSRKPLVWEVAETYIGRYIGEHGHMARLDDDTFLVITPGLEGVIARIQVVRALREILTHFLGEQRLEDIAVRVVNGFSEGELSCRALTVEEVQDAIRLEAEPAAAIQAPPPGGMDIGARKERHFYTLEGRRLRFSVSVAPLIDLAKGAITAHRIEPTISFDDTRERLSAAARRRLMPADIQEVDIVTVERALSRLQGGESAVGRPSVVASVSFLTVTNARARAALVEAISQARETFANSIVFELTDFDAGVPKSRLQEATALLRPFCRAVFARDQVGSGLVKEARSLGIVGLVYEPPHIEKAEDTAVWLLNTGRVASAHAGPKLVVNLDGAKLAPMAAAAGFTHATLKAR